MNADGRTPDEAAPPSMIGLDSAALEALAPYLRQQRYRAGALILRQGDQADCLGVLLEGEVVVWCQEDDLRVDMARLQPGDWFGGSCLTSGTRSASISAATGAEVAFLGAAELLNAMEDEQLSLDPRVRVLVELVQAQHRHLARTNAAALAAAQEQARSAAIRARSATAVAVLVSLMSIYAYGVGMLSAAQGKGLELASLGVAALASAGAAAYVHQAQLPWAAFGLTLRGLGPACRAVLAWTAGFAAVTTLLKGLGIALLPAWEGLPLLLWPDLSMVTLAWCGAYLLSSVIQEFAARSFLHTAFEQIFSGRWSGARAAVLSNLVFSVFHLHYSASFAVVTFTVGLMYSAWWIRHRSLIGVSLLHALTGLWAMDVLGVLGLPLLGLPEIR